MRRFRQGLGTYTAPASLRAKRNGPRARNPDTRLNAILPHDARIGRNTTSRGVRCAPARLGSPREGARPYKPDGDIVAHHDSPVTCSTNRSISSVLSAPVLLTITHPGDNAAVGMLV